MDFDPLTHQAINKNFLKKIEKVIAVEIFSYDMPEIIQLMNSMFDFYLRFKGKTCGDGTPIMDAPVNFYTAVDIFLVESISKLKRNLTGQNFSAIFTETCKVQEEGIYKFNKKFFEKMEYIFLNDHEGFMYQTTDIYNMLHYYESQNLYGNQDKVLLKICEKFMETNDSHDSNFIKIYHLFD
jgi:hypothetical protein